MTKQIDPSEEWIVEGIAQFLKSPLWSAPIQNFIDGNCVVFGELAQHEEQEALDAHLHGKAPSFRETPIDLFVLHKRFASLVDDVLTGYVEELGVEIQKVVDICTNTANPDGKKFIDYILALDDYNSFKSLMVKRNLELEYEAIKALEANAAAAAATAGGAGAGAAAPSRPLTDAELDDEEQLRAAIAVSLSEARALERKHAELEDAELQEAMALSRAAEEQYMAQLRAEQQALFDEIAKSREKAKVAQMEDAAEAAAHLLALEEQAAKAKTENDQKEREAAARAAQKEAEIIKKRQVVAEKVAEIVTAAPPKAVAAVPAFTKPAAPAVAPAAPAAPGLAPVSSGILGAGGRIGGFSKLPVLPSVGAGGPIVREEIKPLSAMVAGKLGANAAAATTTQSAPKAAETAGVSQEEIERRQKYLREQRDAIIKKRQAEREAELAKFAAANGAPAPSIAAASAGGAAAPGAGKATDEAHAKLSVELARRFREDIVRTAQ